MDAKTIVNLGLALLGQYSISSLSPAVTPLEKKCALRYTPYKQSELTKGRWVCAVQYAALTEGGGLQETAERPYSFALPSDCLRVLRDKGAKWQQRGRYLYHSEATLTVPYIADIVEADMDPLLVDVIAARVAREMCEDITQSNSKQATCDARYIRAVKEARAANALIIGSDEQVGELDDDDDWFQARRGVGL